MIRIDATYLSPDVSADMAARQQARLDSARATLTQGTGAGGDFLGWLDPAQMVTDAELSEILEVAADLREKSDVLVSIGIGGSYLGTRAVLEALGGDRKVEFAGQTLSARYHADLLERLSGKRIALNAISKSGTTTEPAVAFRLLRPLAAPDAIVATTDRRKGALRKLAAQEDWPTFPIDDAIGGRYSVLSAVGLLPLAYAGIDVAALRKGAIDCAAACAEPDPLKNPALFYAASRNLLYGQGFAIEALVAFEPRLHFVLEWWKQLFGESEGKDHASLFPASAMFTTDLHSLGQWFQQGRRILCETFLTIGGGEPELKVPAGDDADELSYLTGEPLSAINGAAHRATSLAHRTGGVPNLTIEIPTLDAYHLGYLLYFFEFACGVSGYLLGVNPFDQPGVEAYKVNMFTFLGKPGYAEKAAALEATASAYPPLEVGF